MRICIYIDASNLKLSAQKYNIDYDIFLLIDFLKNKYYVSECKYFVPNFSSIEQEILDLRMSGVQVITKEVYNEYGKTKANCDVEITNEITLDIRNDLIDKVILVSGDGDFYSLLKYVESNGKEAKVVGIHPRDTAKLYRSGNKFGLTYVTLFKDLVSKRKAFAGGPAKVLFDNLSLTNVQNLSSAELVNFSQNTKIEAGEILKMNKVIEMLNEFGEVRFGGSYFLDLMYGPDIDIEVKNDNPAESARMFFNKILDQQLFQKQEFGNFEKFERKNRPKAFIVVCKLEYKNRKWEIEIWFKKEFNQENILFENRILKLSDEKKLLILKEKQNRENFGLDKFKLSSFEIYSKIINS